MASDKDLVSKEEHELNYVLKKYNKRQTKENREKLVESLDNFNKDSNYKPHNRENFYKYIEEKGILSTLE
ncbi:MAG TPA: hypothetical protein PKW55_02835 [Spirochaetota bacterium]|nr:hypothetical protein [Spirochaetota bacterium]HOM38215.1 hypothetical protein [Spirochaetota bacterium]HPQ48567.1 hypothetical protein [Spirochaetota bacterium]